MYSEPLHRPPEDGEGQAHALCSRTPSTQCRIRKCELRYMEGQGSHFTHDFFPPEIMEWRALHEQKQKEWLTQCPTYARCLGYVLDIDCNRA